MNKILRFIVVVMLMHGMMLKARNKQQIFFTNEYGKAITVLLHWRNKNFPYDYKSNAIQIAPEVKSRMVKAPISTYGLVSLSVMPSENNKMSDADWAHLGVSLASVGIAASGVGLSSAELINVGALSLMGGNLIYRLDKEYNEAVIDKINKAKFFVIKAGQSTIKTNYGKQKEIQIYGYKSQEHYNQEIAKQDTKMVSAVVA